MSQTIAHPRRLGPQGAEVSALGLGTMSMGNSYGQADDTESIATLERALELGINFFDSADFYGVGHSEELLREVIRRHRREELFLSVKVGPMLVPGGGLGRPNGHPDYLKSVLAYDLRRLGVDHIDLYFPSRIDRTVPLEDQIGALVEMQDKGFIRHIGLSEVSAATVRRASALHAIAAVQSEYSLWTRDPEDELLPTLRELGIALVAYAPLSRGFLSGTIESTDSFGAGDIRRHSPRFQSENFDRNRTLVARLREIAAGKGVTAAQLALAWVLAQGGDIITLVGTKSRARLEENFGALAVALSEKELAGVEAAIPKNAAAGERYPAAGMKSLNG